MTTINVSVVRDCVRACVRACVSACVWGFIHEDTHTVQSIKNLVKMALHDAFKFISFFKF